MPILIKKIQGEAYTTTVSDIVLLKSVVGQIQGEDYINLNGLVAYLQNLTEVQETAALPVPTYFGLANTVPPVTLNITY